MHEVDRHEILIEGFLGKNVISGLIDSGATLSYMSEEIFDSDMIKPYRRSNHLIDTDLMIELGDGSTI